MQPDNPWVFGGDKKFQPEFKVFGRAGQNVVEPDRMSGNYQLFSLFSIHHLEMDDLGRVIATGIKKMVAADTDLGDGKPGPAARDIYQLSRNGGGKNQHVFLVTQDERDRHADLQSFFPSLFLAHRDSPQGGSPPAVYCLLSSCPLEIHFVPYSCNRLMSKNFFHITKVHAKKNGPLIFRSLYFLENLADQLAVGRSGHGVEAYQLLPGSNGRWLVLEVVELDNPFVEPGSFMLGVCLNS